MSRENVEIVRRIAEAFDRGGLDAVGSYFHPDIEWHEDPSFPEAGVYRGIDAVQSYARQFLSEFEEFRYEPVELTDAGDHVIANLRITGRGKTSGAEFEIYAWWAFSVQDRKVTRCYSYLERDRALGAVGLSA
jgi:ketosteroid isomerase-like protein